MISQTQEISIASIYSKDTDTIDLKAIRAIRTREKHMFNFVKRSFDIIASGFAIVILSPLLLLISILVKLTSKGPVLFKDQRIGLHGVTITVYKFRSMYIDAEENIEKYLTPEQIEIWLRDRKLDNDPRITKIGKFLRKTSLDELPQLFNIFNGSLSVVGPRPIGRHEMKANYTHYQMRVLLSVKPGLTGVWAVYGRSDCTYESKERQFKELSYVDKRSVLFDLKLILLTIPAVLKHRGAQ